MIPQNEPIFNKRRRQPCRPNMQIEQVWHNVQWITHLNETPRICADLKPYLDDRLANRNSFKRLLLWFEGLSPVDQEISHHHFCVCQSEFQLPRTSLGWQWFLLINHYNDKQAVLEHRIHRVQNILLGQCLIEVVRLLESLLFQAVYIISRETEPLEALWPIAKLITLLRDSPGENSHAGEW